MRLGKMQKNVNITLILILQGTITSYSIEFPFMTSSSHALTSLESTSFFAEGNCLMSIIDPASTVIPRVVVILVRGTKNDRN
jgi:hypothetical protein